MKIDTEILTRGCDCIPYTDFMELSDVIEEYYSNSNFTFWMWKMFQFGFAYGKREERAKKKKQKDVEVGRRRQ